MAGVDSDYMAELSRFQRELGPVGSMVRQRRTGTAARDLRWVTGVITLVCMAAFTGFWLMRFLQR